jgi:glyoxylase I family protein
VWLRDPDRIWLELYWMNADFFIDRLREQWHAKQRAAGRPERRRRPPRSAGAAPADRL